MSPRRAVLLGLAALLGALTLLIATTDVRVGRANCGSALLPADDDRPRLRSGDADDDDFARSALAVDCDHALTGRRLLAALPGAAAAAVAFVARRDRLAATANPLHRS